jgi:hypothetical protein
VVVSDFGVQFKRKQTNIHAQIYQESPWVKLGPITVRSVKRRPFTLTGRLLPQLIRSPPGLALGLFPCSSTCTITWIVVLSVFSVLFTVPAITLTPEGY